MTSLNICGSRRERSSPNWKRAARVNCIILICLSALLLVVLSLVLQHGVNKVIFFYSADCKENSASHVNTGLHLLINIISTLVILNAPSRDEVDQAHVKGSWLEIGVSSIRNAFRVSKFKFWCWIGLLLSSIPIHLLFNSTVFETDNRETDFHLTISTKDFFKGGAYYPPGASLVLPGIFPSLRIGSYGYPVDPSDFNDQNSPTLKNISAIATMAGQWKPLENSDCQRIYSFLTCSGLREYSDVVLIINRSGWVRDNMWNLSDQDSTFWDRYVPAKAVNHLFFHAQCSMSAGLDGQGDISCGHNCSAAMGQTGDLSARWDYTFIGEESLQYYNDIWPATENNSNWRISGPQSTALDLSVDYCLVRPLQTTCRVGLVSTLLLLVTICVVVKTAIAIRVTLLLGRQEKMVLVTLGDAIASFIEKPDIENMGYCTAGQAEISMALTSSSFFLLSEAREWKTVQELTGVALPASVWAQSYLLLLVAIAVCIGLFVMVEKGELNSTGSFFQGDGSFFIPVFFPLLGAVLLANSAQLLLSFCYVVYNNLFTRLQLAREWATYSDSYNSLRVTEPQGQQTSTYRLQLPYKYSIPLIGISILLHWVLSNTLFVFVSTGGTSGLGFYSSAGDLQDPILPDNTAVFVGYSKKALLTLTVLSIVLIFIPPLLGLKTLPSNNTIPGCNSFALSSACHVSRSSRAIRNQTLSDDTALSGFDPSLSLTQDRSEPNLEDDSLDNNDPGLFGILAQSKLRWGVVEMPPEWYTENGYDGSVGHLSFGVEEDNVSPPINGHLYA
ncbi:hypothetical protein HD806DRAFT_527196 [Xylariaceae sp. AK1471]|nr:hypothetical protein HD806DRAFT_527196 [Xylariaceae sp. AK1471]